MPLPRGPVNIMRQATMSNRLARPSLLALAVSLGTLGGAPSFAAEAMDHSAMSMDHGAMDHSKMNHGPANAPTTTSRTPIPILTDADREAAFPPLGGHEIHDSGINSFFLLDQLEYQDADEGSTLAWDASGG